MTKQLKTILATVGLLTALTMSSAAAQTPTDTTAGDHMSGKKMTSKMSHQDMMDKMDKMSADEKAAMFDKMSAADKMHATKMAGHDMSKNSSKERMEMMGKMTAQEKADMFDKMPMEKRMSMMKGDSKMHKTMDKKEEKHN